MNSERRHGELAAELAAAKFRHAPRRVAPGGLVFVLADRAGVVLQVTSVTDVAAAARAGDRDGDLAALGAVLYVYDGDDGQLVMAAVMS